MQRAHRSVGYPGFFDLALAVALVVMLAAAACDDHGMGGSPAGAPPMCGQLDRQIHDALADLGSCVSDNDCTIIGGQVEFATCDCAAYVVDCAGMPIAKNAPGMSRAEFLIQQFISAGCAVDKACDCAPRGPVHCSADHHCSAAEQSCFPPPPDAGID